MSLRRSLLTGLLAGLLASAHPAAAEPAPVPQSNGPESEASEPVRFLEAIKRAMEHNTDPQVAVEEILRVQGLLAQATAALMPQVAVAGLYTRIEGDRLVMMRRSEAANSVEAQLNVNTPIVDLKAFADRKRARDQVEVTAAEADSIRRDVAIATARAYFAAFAAGRQLENAQRARDTAKSHVDYSRARREAKVGTELDLSRDEAELATTEAAVASEMVAKLRTEEALGVIIGSERPAVPSEEPDLSDQPGDGLAARADVIFSRRRRVAAVESRARDWTDWAPSLRLVGQAFLDAPQIDPLPRYGYQLVFTLDMPLYDGGYRHGAHDQHVALEREALEQEAGVGRQARYEIRIARAAVHDARAARDASRLAAEKAAHTLELAGLGYKAGTTTGLEIVDAQRVALDAATQAVISDDDYRQAQLDLLAATGAFPPRF